MRIDEYIRSVRIIENSDCIIKITEDPAICEKCGHIVHIFKDCDIENDNEVILTECSNCKNMKSVRRKRGFWWLYFSVLDFNRMYKNILHEVN